MAYFRTGTATIDGEFKIVRAEQGFYQFIGWETPRFLEQSVCREDFPKLKSVMQSVLATGERTFFTYRVLRPDESLHWVVADITKETLGTQEEFVCLNIQSLEELEQELNGMETEIRELGTYLDLMDELFFKYNIQTDEFSLFTGGEKQQVHVFKGSLEEWELSFSGERAISEKYQEAFENFCEDLRQGSRLFSHEAMLPHLVRGDAEELYLLKGRTVMDAAGDAVVLGCIYTMSKNSYRRKSRLGESVGRDDVTGLLSKRAVTEYIRGALESQACDNAYLCILDVDNFKYVNDNFGHMFGDEVLITVADILKTAVGDRGVVGRFGGDEMIIFLEKIADRIDLRSILRTIRTNVEWAYKGVRDDLHLSCSIGAAAFPADADNYENLFKVADKMLYLAKKGGKNRYVIYTPEIHGDLQMGDDGQELTLVEHKRDFGGNKEHLILEIMENFLHKGMMSIQLVLEETGVVFDLAETDIFFDEAVYQDVHWRADGSENVMEQIDYAQLIQFRRLFDENRFAAINHTADLEFSCPTVYQVLKERHVTAGLIYWMNGKVPGYITFFKEEMVSRLWTESDKAYLNLVAKMLELVIGGR
jgi:diguanylate cyclase (GGDEF)-like protein